MVAEVPKVKKLDGSSLLAKIKLAKEKKAKPQKKLEIKMKKSIPKTESADEKASNSEVAAALSGSDVQVEIHPRHSADLAGSEPDLSTANLSDGASYTEYTAS